MTIDSLFAKAQQIKLVIFDIDGVLTDGTLFYTDTETQFKAFHVHDGVGIKLLEKAEIHVAVITSHDTPVVARRTQALGIRHVYQGQRDKLPAYEELKNKLNLPDEAICYVGDDLPDLPLIRRAGLGITVANGANFVKQHADWTTTQKGGTGAVREICELILTAQNKLDALQNDYLR